LHPHWFDTQLALVGHSDDAQQALLAMHTPLQNFCPEGHLHSFATQLEPPLHSPLLQQPAVGMQASLHFLCVPSQVKSQFAPSHVADPYCGTAHASHELGPQPLTLVFGRHTPEQSCVPSGH
jgi:hypothetical protein